ncbi:MAG TPA: hypothetical protein VIC29_13690 [Steroidobacteraceae bacterium]
MRITLPGSRLLAAGTTTPAREIAAKHVSTRARPRRHPVPVDLRDLLIGDSRAPPARRGTSRPEPIEVCCHPATAAADTSTPSPRRGEELEYPLSPRLHTALPTSRAALVSYWRV